MQGADLFYLRGVSDLPLTAAQVADLGNVGVDAVPVKVEIYDDVAVAFFAPNGVAQANRAGIVALWAVVDPHPIDGTSGALRPGDVWTVNTPDVAGTATLPIQSTPTTITETVNTTNYVGVRLVDFFNRLGDADELLLLQRLNAAHPGCL